jgi:hypothetical protein
LWMPPALLSQAAAFMVPGSDEAIVVRDCEPFCIWLLGWVI